MVSSRASALVHSLRNALPHGGELPVEEWERRHRVLSVVVCVLAGMGAGYALLTGYSVSHSLLHLAAVATFVPLAAAPRLGRGGRSLAASFGLLTAAAMGVHTSGGLIEAHFSFFVVIVALTLYEDWTVFLLAVAYVLVHHGALGMIEPEQVFHDPEQFQHPWKWASVHAVFVAAAGAAGVMTWRVNESVRRRMRETQAELHLAAVTDSLTGLGNRRQLMTDLEPAIGTGAVLALFDLDGFKTYNDTFGHPAGDALLQRLGGRLRADIGAAGRAYRLGGDEFCVIADEPGTELTVVAAARALREAGEAFTITNSYGTVLLGTEATSAPEALRIADQRMYERKSQGRPSAGAQSEAVLRQALTERHPDLGVHVRSVADAAESVARVLCVPDDQIAVIRHAAMLHDIGKVAIPDSILAKTGPLDDEEWNYIHRHTIIGERIIGASPALLHAARLVRSSHENWDGSGYPDGLAGEDIPLGSRIVAVCDAFDAMVRDRTYQPAQRASIALTEIERSSGRQFDPTVVAAHRVAVTEPREKRDISAA